MGKKMRKVGSVRAFRARGAVGAVTIGAVYHGRKGHRRFQTGHIAIDAGRGDRMERGPRLIELEARIRLSYLPGNRRLDPARIICVTFETHLVLILDLLGGTARDSHTGSPSHRPGHNRRLCSYILDGVRIMTIDAFNMSCRGVWRFFQIVDSLISGHVMPTELGKIGSQIGPRNRTVVATQAIVLRSSEVEQPFVSAGRMRPVTTLTSVVGNRSVLAALQIRIVRHRSQSERIGVARRYPSGQIVTALAHLRSAVGHDQEVAVSVVMGVMASSALQFARSVELKLVGHRRRRAYLHVFGGQGRRVDKTDRVVVREIRPEVVFAGSNVGASVGAAADALGQRYGSVVTTQAVLARSRWLADDGFQRRALVNVIDGGR